MSKSTRQLLLGRRITVGAPNLAPTSRISELLVGVLSSRRLTNNGPYVRQLEAAIASDLDVEAVLTSSGTTALELCLRTLPKGEVILPSFTFVATAHAVVAAGHKPVFADIDAATHCLSAKSAAMNIGSDTVCILPVHLWGNPAEPEEFAALAAQHSIALMFDAAHAYGTKHGHEAIGRFGRCSAFSLHATKAFSSGEGGLITTSDPQFAEQLRQARTFGMEPSGEVESWGGNYRMSELHAALGLANFEQLSAVSERNRENYEAYRYALSGRGLGRILEPAAGNRLVSYVVFELDADQRPGRDAVVAQMADLGVELKTYFAPPVHRMKPYRTTDWSLPTTDAIAASTLVLPTGMQLTPEECVNIAHEIVRILSSRGSENHFVEP